MKTVKKSVLLKTSTISDVQSSGGWLTITGCYPVKKSNILDFRQIKSKVEVVQVVKVGYSGYTPTADTEYTIEINGFNVKREGYTGLKKVYSYVTPSVLTNIGATAALQREFIHLNLVAKINADQAQGAVPVTAASLLTGTGITLTDDAGYYPANPSNGRQGASVIRLITNADGSGWLNNSLENIVTTAAVYSFGQGARMLQDMPVLYAYTQNLSSGDLGAPVAADGTYATSGQKYDAFIISSVKTAPNGAAITDQLALVPQEFAIFVDNGTGTSTSNLTGFIAFEKAMLRELFGLYVNDASAYVDFFDNIGTFSGSATPAPIGTNAATNNMNSGKFSYTYFVNGTATILAPYATATGLPLSLDATDDEGMELSAPVAANSPKEFIIGKTEFSLYTKINLDDISGTDAFYVGFRAKAAYAADPNSYTDMATLALVANAGLINMSTILNNAATVNKSTGITWADTETHDLEVRVLIDGSVKFFVDSVEKTSLQATAFVFDAGDTVIPFLSYLNTSDVGVPLLQRLAVIPTAYWKL